MPDLHSFTAGLKIALNPDGIITLEFPHLLRLMDEAQFDTIYHEHFSYLSLLTAQKIFAHHGLTIFDVEELQHTADRSASSAGTPKTQLTRRHLA